MTLSLKPYWLILPLCGLTACTTLGPDFIRPQPLALPASWTQDDTQQAQNDTALWWQQFHDPVLNQLVEQAGAQNLDLEAAGLRILQARSLLGVADGGVGARL